MYELSSDRSDADVNYLDSVELGSEYDGDEGDNDPLEFNVEYYRDQVRRPSMQHDAFMRQSGFYNNARPVSTEPDNSDEEVKHDREEGF